METRKLIAPAVLAICTLIVLTFGATYAYFTVTTTKNVSVTAAATTASVGSVALKSGTSISMNITASQMMNKGSNKTYYAPTSGTTPTETATTTNVATTDTTGTNTYTCTYSLNVAYSGTLKAALSSSNTGWAILNIAGTDYDIATTSFPLTISNKTLSSVSDSAEKNVTGSLRIVNLTSTDQSAMAGKTATFTITATAFSCTAV